MMTRGAGDEREILEVSHVTEEDFETTEGTSEDLYDKLMEMAGGSSQTTRMRKRTDIPEILTVSKIGYGLSYLPVNLFLTYCIHA